jgi:hypothetical protein
MDEYSPAEELHLAAHFYGYLITIAIAGFALFLVSVEPNILRQFRSWISVETFNNYVLTWFTVSGMTALLIFFIGVLMQLFRKSDRLINYIWYFVILSFSLFFSTFFLIVFKGRSGSLLITRVGILIITNIATFLAAGLFYAIHYTRSHNFFPLVLGILAATTAFNWFYLSLIVKISVF